MGRVECVTPHEPWFCKRVTPPLPEVGRTRRNNVDVKIRTEGVNEAKTGADRRTRRREIVVSTVTGRHAWRVVVVVLAELTRRLVRGSSGPQERVCRGG